MKGNDGKEYPYAFYDSCGGVAFYCNYDWTVQHTPNAKDFIYESGEHPKPGSQIVCGHCGKPMKNAPIRKASDGG